MMRQATALLLAMWPCVCLAQTQIPYQSCFPFGNCQVGKPCYDVVFLQPLPGDFRAAALDINNHGLVVGVSDDITSSRAVYWDLSVPGGENNPIQIPNGNIAYAVNDLNQVVGSVRVPELAARECFWVNLNSGQSATFRLPGALAGFQCAAFDIQNSPAGTPSLVVGWSKGLLPGWLNSRNVGFVWDPVGGDYVILDREEFNELEDGWQALAINHSVVLGSVRDNTTTTPTDESGFSTVSPDGVVWTDYLITQDESSPIFQETQSYYTGGAINDLGEAVAGFSGGGGRAPKSWLLEAAGGATYHWDNFGTLDINNRGTIVGYGGVIWKENGQYVGHDLRCMAEGDPNYIGSVTTARAINSRGDIVGFDSDQIGTAFAAFPRCPFDFDYDGDTDLGDYGQFFAYYGSSPRGDLDGDGDTDLADLGVFFTSYPCSSGV